MQKSVRLLLFQPERIYFRSFAPNRGAGSQSCSLHMPRCHLLPMLLIGCAIEFCPSSQIHSSLFNSSLMEANFSNLQPLGALRSSLFVHSHLYIFSCSEFICNSVWPFVQIGSGQIELYSCQKCTFEVWLVVSEFSLRHEPFLFALLTITVWYLQILP